MSAFQRVGYTMTLAALAMFVGCSTPREEPVYADVPGYSTPLAQSGVAHDSSSPAVQPAAEPEQTTADAEPVTGDTQPPELIVTPDESRTGTVVSVNNVGRFVVLKCPLGRVPAVNSTLFVYRRGLKVAELRVTGPQEDDHTVADIRSGECRVNDEVRDQ